ncbi:MAG: SGNH/GDSL hydrolase family protein, partial [Chloroflexi bacterium]|nr:SGNH/GDSL hydrolase family protein [Chloroflexota bacterium]
MSKKEWILIILGVVVLLLGLALNEWVLASFTADGQINAFGQLLIIRLFNIAAILSGSAIIYFRKSPIVHKLLISLGITVLMIAIFDLLLYWAAPLLPSSIVAGMSPNAQVRYYHATQASQPWVYDKNVRYAKPNTNVDLFEIPIQADALGYRNPVGYLEQQGAMDVLLFGDSFVWGTEEVTIADYLRELSAPLGVYSLGMAGSGIPQWQYHFQRYMDAVSAAPKVVVLNFYSGNDITDTDVFLGLEKANGWVDSADYFTFINFQFLVPTSQQKVKLPKLPELFFLTNYVMSVVRASEVQAAETSLVIDGQLAPVCKKHREPLPGALNDAILAQISDVVVAIRAINPDTKIILSYIPTSGGIYGDLMTDCPDYRHDLARQAESSAILSAHVETLDVHYVDFTPTLREAAETAVIWSHIDHFSPDGYKL